MLLLTASGAVAEFKVSQVIHPVVAKLGEPQERLPVKGLMAISTSSKKAEKHVKQGLAHFNALWDFEAYRHFCAGAEADPECLMAYWGIVMSLAGNKSEFFGERAAAVERIVELLERENPPGVKLEQSHALAASLLVAEGSTPAALYYLDLSNEFPNDIQSQLLANFLMRDGYDELGRPRLNQEKSTEAFNNLLKKFPNNAAVTSWWLATVLENPDAAAIKKSGAVEKLTALIKASPGFPPYRLAMAHLQFRLGNFKEAQTAANDAEIMFSRYLKDENLEFYDCEGWIKSLIYKAHLAIVQMDFGTALDLCDRMAKMKIEEERLFSRGASVLLWQGRTLGGRMFASGHEAKHFETGAKLLERVPAGQWFTSRSLVGDYRDGLLLYLGARKALVEKNDKALEQALRMMGDRVQALAKKRKLAAATAAYAEYLYSLRTLITLGNELKGLAAQRKTGAMQKGAVNWFDAAIGTQNHFANLLPPGVSYPMERRLAMFQQTFLKDEKAAREVLKQGLAKRPQDPGLLRLKADLPKP